MLVSFFRIIKFSFQNFYRNIWLSLATISIIVLTLLSISFLAFLNVLTLEASESIKDKIDISVYFKPEVLPQEVKNVQNKLLKLDKIQNVRYLSRSDSLELLKQRHNDDLLIQESLNELGTNPLGDTLVIKAYKVKDYPLILEALEKSQYKGLIEDKNYQDNQSFLNKIQTITDKIKKIGWIISGFFSLIAVLIVFNTIRIAIYTHSEEISIMKLVGASNWFIRAPFLAETVLYAFFGTIITLILLYPVLKVINPYILNFFDNSFNLIAYYLSNLALFAWWQFAGILVLTIIASFLALGRYLDV